jgi:hypothetical protein
MLYANATNIKKTKGTTRDIKPKFNRMYSPHELFPICSTKKQFVCHVESCNSVSNSATIIGSFPIMRNSEPDFLKNEMSRSLARAGHSCSSSLKKI